MNRRVLAASSLLLTLALAACWGAVRVGGTLSGLPSGASVTLQNNGGDNLTLSANGAYEFSGTLDEGATYAVTVLTQPSGANCTVANATGTVGTGGRDITNVNVTCEVTASIGGTVSGLLPGTAVTLANSGPAGGTVVVATNGAFAFAGIRPNGEAYNVTVATNGQPAGLTCVVANGSGNVVTGTPANITVTCQPN